MTAAQSNGHPPLEVEIASLEAEMARVVALPTTSDAQRADLADRLRRLKQKAGVS